MKRKCQRCGAEYDLPSDAIYCPKCGANLLSGTPAPYSPPSPPGYARVVEYQMTPEEAQKFRQRIEDEIRRIHQAFDQLHRTFDEAFRKLWEAFKLP